MYTDMAIIGAGFTGASLAHAIPNDQIKVALIDRAEYCPDVFRAEKIESDQADLMKKMGILDYRVPKEDPVGETLNFDDDVLEPFDTIEQYGISYSDTVNNLRANLPKEIQIYHKTVTRIENHKDGKEVHFSDQTSLVAKLVVICTGGGEKIISDLGVKRKVYNEFRSLSFGFDVEREDGKKFEFNGFNYFLPANDFGVHYITIFPIGNRMRVNLFTCMKPKDPLVQKIKKDTIENLSRIFPGIYEYIGKIDVTSKVQVFPTIYYKLKNPAKDNIVILSDDYQSVNPVTGSGLSKVLTDVFVLSSKYIPLWFEKNDFSKKSIDEFYNDKLKTDTDRKSMESWLHFANDIHDNRISIIQRIRQKLMLKGWL